MSDPGLRLLANHVTHRRRKHNPHGRINPREEIEADTLSTDQRRIHTFEPGANR